MNETTIIYNTDKLQKLVIKRNDIGLFDIFYKKMPEEIVKDHGRFKQKEICEDTLEITECDIKSIKIIIETKEGCL